MEMLMRMTSWIFALWLALGVEAARYDYNDSSRPTTNPIPRHKRYIMTSPHLWPKALVPYSLEPSALRGRTQILRAIHHVEDQSCVRFLPWSNQLYHQHGLGHQARVTFFKGEGCFSDRGFSKQGVRTSCCEGDSCLHEIGHALGFVHEQSNKARQGWIDVLYQNIPEKDQTLYSVKTNPLFKDSDLYDISTIMHYGQLYYFKDRPVYAKDFPELPIAHQDFYHFKEMAEGYRCQDMPQCQGRDLGCENDGYQTIQHGVCRCVCPTGLDPDNQCRTPLKKVPTGQWPKGQYALLKLQSGCPSGGDFKEGRLVEYGATGNSLSSTNQMAGYVDDTELELEFCTRTTKDDDMASEGDDRAKFNWPAGTFCIFMAGGRCPTDFIYQTINYTVDVHATKGEIPDLRMGSLQLCCQFRGFPRQHTPFPVEKPFMLIQHPIEQCQQVEGMRYTHETLTISSQDIVRVDGDFYKWRANDLKAVTIPLCQYTPVNKDCGHVYTLSKDRPDVIINVTEYRGLKDLECTWLVMGDSDKGTMVLDFEEFDVGPEDRTSNCLDKVEVRHALVGQQGLEYCGRVEHSIRSITNKMMVRFFTMGQSQSSFKAKIKWIPDDEMCYNVDQRGRNYNGNMNYTRTFQPCLPWAQMSDCPHNPYTGDGLEQIDQLTGNACRNPDNSFRPWCYTDKIGCQRNYCDVCGLEKPYDQIALCHKLKETGFCTRDAAIAIKYCAATCFDQLTTKPLNKKYTEMSCPKPVAPSDGVVTSQLKTRYSLGDVVSYKCRTGSSVVNVRCLTSGQWSKVSTACNACPPGHVHHGTRCFVASSGTSVEPHYSAVMTCKNKGGELAAPKNKEESDIIMSLTESRDIWIGISDSQTEGSWLYQDGSPLTWTNWDTHEPNNVGNEDCAAMKASNKKWLDIACRYSYPFVCSIPDGSVRDDCQDRAGGKTCQELITERPTMCQEFSQFAKDICPGSCGVCLAKKVMCPLTGDQRPNVRPVVTVNSIPAIFVGESFTFTCQDFKYPVKGHSTRACLTNGKLSGQPLECGECPLGFTLVDDQCHGLIPGPAMTYKDAKAACRKLDGFLAMPKTRAGNDVISKVGLGVSIWLGIDDIKTKGTFEWQDGSGMFWTHWSADEPMVNAGVDFDCVSMAEDSTWITEECEGTELYTVCTIPKSDDDTCYDMKDGGVSYDGDVNYTRTYKPCLPWTLVTRCPHHAYNKGDEQDNLVGNACRNPDQSYRPWCYTDVVNCKRNYCDVCGNEIPKDSTADCSLFKSKGLCIREPTRALKECAATCLDILPGRTPVRHYPNIHCGPPTPPRDGRLVGTVRRSNNVGDSVEYKCQRAEWSVFARCMTSGQWSQTGFACPACPTDSTHYGDHCLQYMNKRGRYEWAADDCAALGHGGQVAVPSSPEESDFFFQLAGQNAAIWIGLTDRQEEGKWVTDDGRNATWTKWNPGSPKSNRKENCVYMIGAGTMSTWLELTCKHHFPYICSLPTLNADGCQDFLVDQCPVLLAQDPRMCQERPEFASLQCAKTCGVCISANRTCPLPELGHNVFQVKQKPVKTGDYLELSCTSDTYPTDGDKVRACLPSGEWTGKSLQCGDCPVGFKLVANTCMGPVEGRTLTFDEAEKECRRMGGYVAMPTTIAENDVISDMGDGHLTWIGATDVITEDYFLWVDGRPINWINWAAEGSSNRNSPETNCVAMDTKREWTHVRCTGMYRTVCGIPMKGRKCRNGVDGKCYSLVGELTSHKMTYDDGVNACQRMGGKMATPRSMREANYLHDVITLHGGKTISVWLGINDKFIEGSWTYQDGGDLEWTNWAQGEPNDYQRGEDCAVTRSDRQWLDMSCHYEYPVVCEVERLNSETQCLSPIPPSDGTMVTSAYPQYFIGDTVEYKCNRKRSSKVYSRCMSDGQWSDSGFACLDCAGTYYNGNCYKSYKFKVTYDDARAFCAKMGYSLVAPRTKQEAGLLTNMTDQNPMWIGVTDRKTENQWLYEDGSHVTWTNWNPNEPNNNAVGGEDCVVMVGGLSKWIDVPCGYTYLGPLCVKKIVIQ